MGGAESSMMWRTVGVLPVPIFRRRSTIAPAPLGKSALLTTLPSFRRNESNHVVTRCNSPPRPWSQKGSAVPMDHCPSHRQTIPGASSE